MCSSRLESEWGCGCQLRGRHWKSSPSINLPFWNWSVAGMAVCAGGSFYERETWILLGHHNRAPGGRTDRQRATHRLRKGQEAKRGEKAKCQSGGVRGRAEEEAGVAPGGRQSRIIRADHQHEPCWSSRSKTSSYYGCNKYVLLCSKQFSLKCFQWALGLHWIQRKRLLCSQCMWLTSTHWLIPSFVSKNRGIFRTKEE